MDVKAKEEEILLDYLDGQLNEHQSKALRVRLENSPELQQRLDQLRAVHVVLSRTQLEHPSSNFTHRVMDSLYLTPSTNGLSPKNGIYLFLGMVIATSLLILLVASGAFDQSNPFALESLPILNQTIKQPLPTIPFNAKILMNGLIILSLGLAFVLLDRTVLKPYFNRRSRYHV